MKSQQASFPTPATYDLEVRHLSFQYTAQTPPVLQDISLKIPAGGCIALVGKSGAGKSTLAHLLLRFWEYDQGDILLGGQSLHAYHQQDLRRLISVVEQRPHLFHATVRENLLIARTDASMLEITHAMQLAHLHESIQALPQGYDTIIGEQGFKLSAGERQRLAIARAILKDAPILILDEATAHLDAFTEQAILQTIRSLLPGRTTLMITHRLVGLDMADEILVMQAGKIRERGTHVDLLQARGLYWKLWQSQNR